MKKSVFSVFLLLLFLTAVEISALSLSYEGIDGEMGFLWKNNKGYDTEEGDSGPDTLTFIPGVSVMFGITENWFFRPSVYYYGQTLEYLPERGYTIPVDYSNINEMSVSSLFMQPAVGYRFTFKERHTIGLQAAPALNFQIPLFGSGSDDRADMFNALIKEFLYFTFGAWYYNPLTERFGFNFKVETALPVYNLWLDRGLPFSDGLMISFQFGIRVLVK